MKKLLVILASLMLTSCVTVYKNSTVMQYKGKAELLTDSMKISVNNKQLIEE